MVEAPARDDRRTRVRLSRAARRDLLLDAAARIALEQGANAITMEGVALAAGASKTLGYAYFANRDELIVALLEREVARLGELSAPRLATATSFEDLLRAAVGAWFDLVEQRGPLLGALMQATTASEEVGERRDAFVASQEELYAQVATTRFGLDRDVAAAAVVVLFAGLGAVLVRWAESGGQRSVYEETYVQMALAALDRLGARVPDASSLGEFRREFDR